jgi:hypothetical protein
MLYIQARTVTMDVIVVLASLHVPVDYYPVCTIVQVTACRREKDWT